jgi:Aspartate carbamoyltransferase, catalytic chain
MDVLEQGFGVTERPNHLTSTRNLDLHQITTFFERAKWLRSLPRAEAVRLRHGAILGVMFYQNSTRTRLSFEAAIRRIGGTSIGFSDPSTTRAGDFFQETTVDTARILGAYASCVVIRHPQIGIADAIASVSLVPVINGGDGANEHPTQALLDLWMMQQALGQLAGRIIGLVGDPTCRDFRSLFFLLARVGVGKILLLAPLGTTIPPDADAALAQANVQIEHCEDIRELLISADAIDMLPFVLPDFAEGRATPPEHSPDIEDRYKLSQEKLRSVSNRDLHIFHVGPRGPEMPSEVDDCPAVKYFEQVEAGVFLRAAILHELTRSI